MKGKKALLEDWDGNTAALGEGELTYRVMSHEPKRGMVHAFDLEEGMYYVKAEAKGYTPLGWTAVSVWYQGA